MKKLLLITLVLVFGLGATVWADMIPVDSAYWTGSRSTPESSGVIAYDGYAGDFKISWVITASGNADFPYSYSYSLTDLAGNPLGKTPSHFILETSLELPLSAISFSGTVLGPQEWVGSGDNKPNPYMPASIWGAKFDEGLDTYSFLCKVAPIWGDFYTVDGSTDGVWAVAYNSGIGTDPTSSTTNFTPWIPVPDTEGVPAPEPSTLLLIGAGLLGLGFFGKGRFRK